MENIVVWLFLIGIPNGNGYISTGENSFQWKFLLEIIIDADFSDYLIPTPMGIMWIFKKYGAPRIFDPHAHGNYDCHNRLMGIIPIWSPRPWELYENSQKVSAPRHLIPTPMGIILKISCSIIGRKKIVWFGVFLLE